MPPGDGRAKYRTHHTHCGFHRLICKECEERCGSYIAIENEAREILFSVFVIKDEPWLGFSGLRNPGGMIIRDNNIFHEGIK